MSIHPDPFLIYPTPIVTEPTTNWIELPEFDSSEASSGLQSLVTLDHLFVRQKIDTLEFFTGFEGNEKFTIENIDGEKVFWAAEESQCCSRACCGQLHSFSTKIMDEARNEVIQLYRPLRCDSCWCPCFAQEMEVESPPGNYIGRVSQNWSISRPKFSILNQNDEEVLQIVRPHCQCCTCTVEFTIFDLEGAEVGNITKQWSGLGRELFTQADTFGVSFPVDLDVSIKATLLGATFLIVSDFRAFGGIFTIFFLKFQDAMYFSSNGDD